MRILILDPLVLRLPLKRAKGFPWSDRMASIILITIGFIDYLVKWNKITRVMFCSMVAGKKLHVFFSAKIAQDVRWEVVPWGLPAVGLRAPPTRVKYRVKERKTKERETWECLSLSLSRQEKKKKNIGVLTMGHFSDREISNSCRRFLPRRSKKIGRLLG